MSRALISLLLVLGLVSCARPEPPRIYAVKGQVIAVLADRQELTVAHEDIAGFMPAMTMNYRVATKALMDGLAAGDTIEATLEVRGVQGMLTAIRKTGTAPLPENTNQAAMAINLLAEGDAVPDAALIDQDDRRRSLAEWQGSLTLITFIYTSCPSPTFCPLMDQNFSTIQRAVAEDPTLAGQVRLVSISFDPDHDTPAILKAHAARRGADPAVWTFLTGDRVTIDKLAGHFGVAVIRPDQPGEITHNLRTTLVGRDGRIVKIYSGGDWTPGAVLADLRTASRP